MKKTALSLAVACAMGASSAAMAYQFEVSLGFDTAERSSQDNEQWSLSGTYYLAPIDDSTGPLAEAAFLNKASYVTASYGYLANDAQGHAYSLGGEYVIPEGNFIIGANYGWGDGPTGNNEQYNVSLGKYLTDTTTVRLNYLDWESNVTGEELEVIGVSLRHLTGDIGMGRQIAVEGDVSRVEVENDLIDGDASGTRVGVGADLYVNPQFSFGADLGYTNGNSGVSGRDFEVRARYHFDSNFFVAANYGHDKVHGDFPRTKYWGVELATRF